jgi:hypothetical protein
LEPVAKRFEDVPLADGLGAVEIGRRPSNPPGPMKPPGGETPLVGPALERAPGRWFQAGQLAQAGRFELGVETSLTFELAGTRCNDPPAHCPRSLAGWL